MNTPLSIAAWDASMALGVGVIDRAHQTVNAALHQLAEQPEAGFFDAYLAAVTAIEADFREEEGLMEEIAYPSLQVHREQHARVLGGLHHALAAAAEGDTAPAHRAVSLFPQWLTLHQQTMDEALAIALQLAERPS